MIDNLQSDNLRNLFFSTYYTYERLIENMSKETQILDWYEELVSDKDSFWKPITIVKSPQSENSDEAIEENREALDDKEELSPEVLRKMFPEIVISDHIAEQIDDLIPDFYNTTVTNLQKSLLIISNGMARCAELKQLASLTLFSPIARNLKKQIRQNKDSIIRQRQKILSKISEESQKNKSANSQRNTSPSGFSGFGYVNYAADQAKFIEQQIKSRKQTDEYVNRIYEEIRANNKRAAKKRAENWNRSFFKRSYF